LKKLTFLIFKNYFCQFNMLSTAFIISVCLSVRLHREVLEKLEECTKACKILGPSCGETETCWCGACSAFDLCAACNPDEACLGDTCYASLFEDEQETLLSELTDSDCQCENGEACYWGICIDTSEGDTDDEDDACYNCEHCWFGSYCLDPFEDMDECYSECSSVYCDDGYECYCGECISDEDIEDTSSGSSDDLDRDLTIDDRSLMFGLAFALGGLFFLIFLYCMYRKSLTGDSSHSDSVKTKIRRPEVKHYGRMDDSKSVPRITSGTSKGTSKENSWYECSLSSTGNTSSDNHTLNTRGVGLPRKDRKTSTSQLAIASRSNRGRNMHREPR